MSKNVKSLICALMAGTMLATSTGLVALAEDPVETTIGKDGAAVVATETPETFNGADVEEGEKDAAIVADIEAEAGNGAGATEAPTENPAARYETDTYYQNALKVVSALGIITGYEDGSVKPESTVTRAEMSAIVLRMLAQTGNSAYKNVFTDVTSAHWAADTIQTAVEQGILDGMGDGTFVPDGNVKYEQVMKMIVCAMNYGTDAENAGGYPQGYVATAGTALKLLTGVNGTIGNDMPRGEVIKTVYNALLASYREITDFKNGLPVYTSKDTLGVTMFDMYEDEGVLTTTPNVTIASGTETKDGVITIDGVDYKCDFNVDEYLATKVKFYYIDDKNDDNKVIAMFSMGKSTEYTFDADMIDSIATADGSMKVYKTETSNSTTSYKINNISVVYNGELLSASQVTGSFDEFITPNVGTVKIVDYDNDGIYDIMFVDKYETMLVTNATSEKLNGKINGVSETVTYDLDDKDYTITVTKSGNDASVKNLKKNDVASIKRNVAGTKIDIIVTGESITGEITSVGEDDGDTTITVNGQVYKVDANAVADIKTGVTGQFFLDAFDRVGYISSDGALTGSEAYAVITKAFYNDENELVIRLYTQEGKEIEAKPSGSMNYWGPGASTSTKGPSEDKLYSEINDDSKFIQCGSNPIKLCKYTLNSSGDISKLYVAVSTMDTSTSEYNNALVIYERTSTSEASGRTSNMNGVSAVGGTLNGYSINDGIVGFTVPDSAEDRGSGANYSTSTVSASRYKSYDGGVDINFAIGGFTVGSTKSAQVLVEFSTSSTSMWEIGELDTASIRPAMIVSKINESVDADGDTIYEIKGYANGSEVSYMTTSTTSVYKFTGWNERQYGGTLIFDATGDNLDADLFDAIAPGDIVAMAVSGNDIRSMVKIVDADDVAKMAVTGSSANLLEWPTGQSAKGSSTRQYYYMGFVSSVDIDDSAFIGLRNYAGDSEGSVTYDASQVFSLVTLTVNESGKVTNTKLDKKGGIEPSELYSFEDDEDIKDYAVFTSLKGGMSNGYIIRVEIDR